MFSKSSALWFIVWLKISIKFNDNFLFIIFIENCKFILIKYFHLPFWTTVKKIKLLKDLCEKMYKIFRNIDVVLGKITQICLKRINVKFLEKLKEK